MADLHRPDDDRSMVIASDDSDIKSEVIKRPPPLPGQSLAGVSSSQSLIIPPRRIVRLELVALVLASMLVGGLIHWLFAGTCPQCPPVAAEPRSLPLPSVQKVTETKPTTTSGEDPVIKFAPDIRSAKED